MRSAATTDIVAWRGAAACGSAGNCGFGAIATALTGVLVRRYVHSGARTINSRAAHDAPYRAAGVDLLRTKPAMKSTAAMRAPSQRE
jgi:hypothetical protein